MLLKLASDGGRREGADLYTWFRQPSGKMARIRCNERLERIEDLPPVIYPQLVASYTFFLNERYQRHLLTSASGLGRGQ